MRQKCCCHCRHHIAEYSLDFDSGIRIVRGVHCHIGFELGGVDGAVEQVAEELWWQVELQSGLGPWDEPQAR